MPTPRIIITLYTRAGCGLCTEAKRELEAISWTTPLTLREIDIESDPALEKAYFDRIPVIEIGTTRLEAPIDPTHLAEVIRHATENS
jgi:glutaredoxin